jgi:hypothetical protein
VDILPKDAAFANFAIGHDVAKMPDLRAFANFARLIHIGGWVNGIRGVQAISFLKILGLLLVVGYWLFI